MWLRDATRLLADLVLLVDDDPVARGILAKHVADDGYRVQTATDGADAASLIDCCAPDLIVTDLLMPRANGFALLDHVRRRPAARYIPVIVLTGYGGKPARLALLDRGADDVLLKPADIDELLARLRARLRTSRHRRELLVRSHTDELTDVRNRRGLLDSLRRELARASRAGTCTSVLLLDVNDFKSINDRLGHAVGDDVLRNVARSLAASVRAPDLVGRLGGDEFVVLLPDAGRRAAATLADRIRTQLPDAISLPLDGAPVTVAVGAATAQHGDDVERLLARADAAMYADKRRVAARRVVTAREIGRGRAR